MSSSKHALRGIVGAVGATILAAGLTFAVVAQEPEVERGDTLNIATIVPGISSYDPSQAQEGHFMPFYQAVYDTLIRRLPNGDLVPMLATEWSYDETQTALTLKLRDDVTFSDGTPFDAAAAKANLDSFRAGTGPQVGTLSTVISVDVVDERTITINLSEVTPALPIYLSNAAGLMASPSALGTEGIGTEPVGSGPYLLDLENYTPGTLYTYVANEDYWDPSLVKFDKIVITPMSDLTARVNAILTGQMDAGQVDPASAAQVEASGNTVQALEDGQQGLFLFDRGGETNPALGDLRVRQAINLAFDREAFVEQLLIGYGSVTNQVFSPATLAFKSELETHYPYDPEQARQLLAEAGYPDGFALTIGTSNPSPTQVAAITQYLADIGIQATFETVTAAGNVAALTSGKYGVILFSLFQPNDWIMLNAVVTPDALYNPFGTSDETTQELLREIYADPASAEASLQELNQYIVEQAWFSPLYRSARLYANGPQVTVEMQVQQAAPSIYNYAPVSDQ